jgi:hypothetical protein
LDAWLNHSSVGQNVSALQNLQPGTDLLKTVDTSQVPKEVMKDPPPKSKTRARKGNFGGERSAKKASLSVSIPDPVPISSMPSSPLPEAELAPLAPPSWNPSDGQVHGVVLKVLGLELQQAGFDSAETQALEVLADVVVRYISKLARNLRVMLDRYGPLTVETKCLWHAWLRSLHISLTELPLFAHSSVTLRQRLTATSSVGEKVPHKHVGLAALVQDNKQILESFQQDQPVRISRQRMQPSSPPRDYSAYFDPTVDANASNFQYSLDSFPPHLASLPQNLDPTDPAYSYPSAYPYYAGSSPSFEPDKPNFYSYVQSNTLPAGSSSPSIGSFPPRRDSR